MLQGGNPRRLSIAQRGDDGTLTLLPSRVDASTNTVSTTVTTTGVYTLVIESLSYHTFIPIAPHNATGS